MERSSGTIGTIGTIACTAAVFGAWLLFSTALEAQ
jgi:hypothetical protein